MDGPVTGSFLVTRQGLINKQTISADIAKRAKIWLICAMAAHVSVPMIRSSVVNQVITAILHCNNGGAFLRREHNIRTTSTDLYDQMALARYLQLFEDAATLANDPLFGARLGHSLPPGELLGPIGFLVLSSRNLRQGMEAMAQFIKIWQDITDITLHDQDDVALWSYRITDEKMWPRRQDAEFTLTATCIMVRAFLGGNWTPLEVHFEHKRPAEWRELQSMFRAPLRFDQPANTLLIEHADLDRPVQGAHAGFAPFLRRHMEDMLISTDQDMQLVEQVRRIVMRDLGRAGVNVASLATELGIPARSLQRYLADEGSSVREIIREVRQGQARSLLHIKPRQVGAVAHAVGYTDPSAFWRAFKAWEGMSPAAFARAQKAKK